MGATIVPLLLVLFPLAMAGGCVALHAPRLVLAVGLATLVVEGMLALSAPLEQPARLLEVGISYDRLGRIVLVSTCIGALAATLAAAVSEHSRYFVATELLIVSCSAAMCIADEPLLLTGLLLLGGLAGGVQLADRPSGSIELIRPRRLAIALRYTVLIALGGLVMLLGATVLGTRLTTTGAVLQRLVFGLLVFGYAVRSGLVPFHSWVPEIADDAPPSTAALHAGVLAVLALPVLLSALQAQPELLASNAAASRLLIGLGTISALAGGALGARASAGRSLAYLAIANLGLLTIGVGIGSSTGLGAALLGMMGHVLGIALTALGLALLSRSPGRRREAKQRGRWPGALALLVGVLLVAGLPPFAGFASKLLLLAAAWQYGALVAGLVVAGITAQALAAGRLLSNAMRPQPAASMYPADEEPTALPSRPEPAPLGAAGNAGPSRVLLGLTMLLSLAAAVAGVWQLPLTAEVDRAVGSFSFTRE